MGRKNFLNILHQFKTISVETIASQNNIVATWLELQGGCTEQFGQVLVVAGHKQIVIGIIDQAVVGHNLYALTLGIPYQRRNGIAIDTGYNQNVHALLQQLVTLSQLKGIIVLSLLNNHLMAQLTQTLRHKIALRFKALPKRGGTQITYRISVGTRTGDKTQQNQAPKKQNNNSVHIQVFKMHYYP